VSLTKHEILLLKFFIAKEEEVCTNAMIMDMFYDNSIDISENNMVELVRDIRSSFGYIDGDFQTFALDIGSIEYDAFIKSDGQYDYVLNLSALKHVRSEKDPFTLMRLKISFVTACPIEPAPPITRKVDKEIISFSSFS